MIRYALLCDKDHAFESWFASADAYEALRAQGHVACAVCGSTAVDKALMAPAVGQGAQAPGPSHRQDAAGPRMPPPPDPELAARIEAFRRHIEASSDYVGASFVSQARAMHLGDLPERPIHGEARIDEARALLEEGVPVAPLPFLPRNRAN